MRRAFLLLSTLLWLGGPALAGMKAVEKSFDYGDRGNARIDYAAGYVEATASGTADVKKMANSVQAETVARRTARHLAYEILAETVGKLQIDATTQYQDAMTVSDALKTETHAVLRGAQVVSDDFHWVDDPMTGGKAPRAIVTVRLPLAGEEGLTRVLNKHLPPEAPKPKPVEPIAPAPPTPAPPTPAAAPGPPQPPAPKRFTSLVVDARALNPAYEATLRPQIRDEKGNVVYGPETVDPMSAASRGGYVQYAPSPDAARTVFGVQAEPLVVTAIAAPGKGQLLLADADARAVADADRAQHFLAEGRVLVVLP